MSVWRWIGAIIDILALLFCLAYLASLLFGFDMHEPKALVYCAVAGYWFNELRKDIDGE